MQGQEVRKCWGKTKSGTNPPTVTTVSQRDTLRELPVSEPERVSAALNKVALDCDPQREINIRESRLI